MELSGKRIWLIGASFGIGEALARQLVAANARVILSARSVDKIAALASELGEYTAVADCDVTDYASVVRAYSEAVKAYGGVDVLIYNAGAYDPMSSADFDLARVEQIIDVNLMGAIRAVHTVLPSMRLAKSGTIALVGSVAGYRGLPKAMGYGLSKAALIHLSENLRQDLDGTGIAIHIINPSFVKTRLTDKNTFAMPLMITAERAASYIIKGIQADAYEIHFPKTLTFFMKAMASLPATLYFWLSKRLL